MRPIAAKERIEVLDVLRGFAIFGIILADVDITFFRDKTLTGVDHVLNQLHGVFVVDKFWPLFSFLFGLGFALQLLRAETRGARFLPVYLRRLFILLLFGLANLMLLLQFGDMPKELAMKNTTLFANEVMPHLRDIWSEYETRWWPKNLTAAAQTTGS